MSQRQCREADREAPSSVPQTLATRWPSLKDSLCALTEALDKAREDYNAADHSSSVDFSSLDSRLRGK